MDPRLERLQQTLESAVAGMSAEEMTWRPPAKWSVAEVLEHLYLTYTGTVKGFQRVVDAGKPLASPKTWANWRQTFVVVGLGYLPSGREAPPVTRPRGLPTERVLAEIGPKIVEMDAIITTCAQKFGARKKLLDHPVLGPLTAAQWSKFHLIHGLHHVKQIRHLRESAK
jgi:hypothetical protein